MRIAGPCFSGLFKVNYVDVSGKEGDFTYRKERCHLTAIQKTMSGRKNQAILVRGFDPKDRQVHGYIATRDAAEDTVSLVHKQGLPLSEKSPFHMPQPYKFLLPAVRRLTKAADIPEVTFEYSGTTGVNEDKFLKATGLS